MSDAFMRFLNNCSFCLTIWTQAPVFLHRTCLSPALHGATFIYWEPCVLLLIQSILPLSRIVERGDIQQVWTASVTTSCLNATWNSLFACKLLPELTNGFCFAETVLHGDGTKIPREIWGFASFTAWNPCVHGYWPADPRSGSGRPSQDRLLSPLIVTVICRFPCSLIWRKIELPQFYLGP